jgi:hypothetical protein
MKIWIGTRYIDTTYFRTWCLNEELSLVYFIHMPKDAHNGEFSLPLLFSSPEEAKKFYEDSLMALNDGAPEFWCLDKHTSFSWVLYFKLHAQQLKLRSAKNKKPKSQNNDNKNITGNDTDGTVPGDKVPRTTWYHNLLVWLRIRHR